MSTATILHAPSKRRFMLDTSPFVCPRCFKGEVVESPPEAIGEFVRWASLCTRCLYCWQTARTILDKPIVQAALSRPVSRRRQGGRP